jgi:transcriptional regulator with XRE-family HTH domain
MRGVVISALEVAIGFNAEEMDLKFPNLNWALAQWGPQYRFAALLGESESWLSRRLAGRFEFSDGDRKRIAQTLGYPEDWLFQQPMPPASTRIAQHHAGVPA